MPQHGSVSAHRRRARSSSPAVREDQYPTFAARWGRRLIPDEATGVLARRGAVNVAVSRTRRWHRRRERPAGGIVAASAGVARSFAAAGTRSSAEACRVAHVLGCDKAAASPGLRTYRVWQDDAAQPAARRRRAGRQPGGVAVAGAGRQRPASVSDPGRCYAAGLLGNVWQARPDHRVPGAVDCAGRRRSSS